MKIAICGSGPLGLELAVKLHQLGAHVTIFAKENLPYGLGGVVRQLAIKESLNKDYVENNLEPKIKYCYDNNLVKFGEVDRVHKRFLRIDERPTKSSRLIDLFRVVYKVIPSKEMKLPKELTANVDQNFLDSLTQGFERFEDFDFVVDATGRMGGALPMGPGSQFALNEKTIKDQAQIFYGYQGILKKELWNKSSERIIIVGSGKTAALTLLQSSVNFKNPRLNVTLITDEVVPFQKFFNEAEDINLINRLSDFFNEQERIYEERIEKFENDVAEWKSLVPEERLKIAKPIEPTPQFDILPGANITSIDKLIDQDQMFVTIESPEFREGGENLLLKTLPTDTILVCTGYRKNSQLDLSGFAIDEPGLYSLSIDKNGSKFSLEESEEIQENIIKNMMSYFSKDEAQENYVQ